MAHYKSDSKTEAKTIFSEINYTSIKVRNRQTAKLVAGGYNGVSITSSFSCFN